MYCSTSYLCFCGLPASINRLCSHLVSVTVWVDKAAAGRFSERRPCVFHIHGKGIVCREAHNSLMTGQCCKAAVKTSNHFNDSAFLIVFLVCFLLHISHCNLWVQMQIHGKPDNFIPFLFLWHEIISCTCCRYFFKHYMINCSQQLLL